MADVKFTLALVDKAAAPARNATKAIKGLESGLKKADTGKLEKGLAKAGKEADGFSKAIQGVALAFGAMKLASVVKDSAFGFAKMGIDAAVAKQNTKIALTTILGDAKKADVALANIHGLANFLGVDPGPLSEQFIKLTEKGHKTADAMRILQGSLDLTALKPGRKLEEVVESFAELDDKGKLAEDALAKFSKMGVNRDTFLGLLGKHLGTDAKGAALAIKNGQVKVETAQKIALESITKQTGKALGGAKKEQGASLGGLIENFESLPKRWASAIDTDKALEPVKKLMVQLTDLLNPDSETGKKFIGVLTKIAGDLGRVFANIDPEKLAKAVDNASVSFDKGYTAAKSFFEGIDKGANGAGKALGFFRGEQDKTFPSSERLSKNLATIGTVLGIVGKVVMFVAERLGGSLVNAFLFVVNKVQWVFDSIGKLIDGFKTGTAMTAIKQIGSDLIDGMWKGITAGWRLMIGKFKALIDLLPTAAKKALGIASPSKVFMKIGHHVTAGMAKGVNDNADVAQVAMVKAIEPPSYAAGPKSFGTFAPAAAKGAAPMPNINFSANVTIEGDVPNAKQKGQQVAASLESEWRRFIDAYFAEQALARGAAA